MNINLDSPFDPEQLLELLNKGVLHQMAKKGYVAQARDDGKMGWVHYTKARTKFHPDADSISDPRNRLRKDSVTAEVDWGELTPIVKRTPQQRVESLVSRLVEDSRRAGTIPGLDDPTIREITGEYWKAGSTEVTSEMIRKIAVRYLEEAEKDARARADKEY